MYQLKNYSQAFFVLSFGRTGSVLLAKNIEKNFRADSAEVSTVVPTLVTAQNGDEFKIVPDPLSIVHGHLMLPQQQLLNYTRVFSIRQQIAEQLVSYVLAKRFNLYHIMANELVPDIEPFEIVDWKYIERLCDSYRKWTSFYAPTLTTNDIVVVYEIFSEQLSLGQIQQKIYPNKDSIITNYQQVIEFINDKIKYYSEIDKFLQHSNSFDIYKYVTR